MSDIETLFNEAEAELGGGDDTATDSQVDETLDQGTTDASDVTEAGLEPETTTEEARAETAPWYADRLEEEIDYHGQKMTLQEALDGGLRRADYTQKTQAVADLKKKAEWADAFLSKISEDPQKAVRDLAVELKLISDDSNEYDPDEVDPRFQTVHALEQQVQQLQLAATEQAVRAELALTKAKYDDFDEQEILPMIFEYGQRGIGMNFEEGYWLWKGQQSSKTSASPTAKAKAAQAAAEAAKKQAAQVAPGRSPAASTTDDPARYRGMSFDEIAAEAAEELGFN